MFENILTGFLLGAITLAVIILLSWVCVYVILDIISRLKKYKSGDNWRIDI